MKKTFVIQVEYPDNDLIPSEEVMEVAQECIEKYMGLHFGANIMDGDYDRIKVKEVTDGFSLVKRMREAQVVEQCTRGGSLFKDTKNMLRHLRWLDKRERLESMVDEYLKKMEE